MTEKAVHEGSASKRQVLRIFLAVVSLVALNLTLVSASVAQSAKPNPGAWFGKAVAFKVKRDNRGLRVVRFRTTYTLGCQTPASGGLQHRVTRLSFRIGGRGRFSGTRSLPLRGSSRNFKVKVSGRFTARRKARGTITWLFPGCNSTRRKWGATGPRRYPSGDDDDGGGGGDVCIWIPLPDGSGFICV